jgi:hypothetical protein
MRPCAAEFEIAGSADEQEERPGGSAAADDSRRLAALLAIVAHQTYRDGVGRDSTPSSSSTA